MQRSTATRLPSRCVDAGDVQHLLASLAGSA
jgi:hypothetical protein